MKITIDLQAEFCRPQAMDSIEQRLLELGYKLPPAPAPAGNYLPFRRTGNLLVLSGVLAISDGQLTHAGAVGAQQSVESGYVAARMCALNALAAIKLATGSLDAVTQFIYLAGFVNAVAGFADSPQVINGASDFLVSVYGDRGKHTRAALAVAGLPKDSTVELQITVEVSAS